MADLKPAETNPWYVLSTLHGPQTGNGIDRELAAKNVALWNIWSCQNLTDEQREKLREAGTELPDIAAWEEQKEEIETLYKKRFSEMGIGDDERPEIPDAGLQIDMSGTVFSHIALWTKAIFSQKANFNFSMFARNGSFDFATFSREADFESTKFSKDSSFNHATFSGRTNFYNAKFAHSGSFSNATFYQYADFSFARFSQHVHFIGASFLQDAHFESTMFLSSSVFSSARFMQAVYFLSVEFSQSANFIKVQFSGLSSFQGSHFGNEAKPENSYIVTFSDTIFERPTSFRDACFRYRYPELNGTVFHDKTQFTAERVFWPQDNQPNPKQAKESCATLRHVMGKQGLPEDEYFFFRKEMEFAGEIGGFWRTRPVKAYGVFSDYGASIAKPLVGLGSLWLFCSLVYMVAFNWPGAVAPEFVPAGKGFGFSIANMVKFLGFQRTYYAEVIQNIPNWMQFMSAVQTTFAYVLVFFLGLGLRSRFRLR
jgi:hypothetical protein